MWIIYVCMYVTHSVDPLKFPSNTAGHKVVKTPSPSNLKVSKKSPILIHTYTGTVTLDRTTHIKRQR